MVIGSGMVGAIHGKEGGVDSKGGGRGRRACSRGRSRGNGRGGSRLARASSYGWRRDSEDSSICVRRASHSPECAGRARGVWRSRAIATSSSSSRASRSSSRRSLVSPTFACCKLSIKSFCQGVVYVP